jgi:O-antigen/teichoic acid export membrane protein
MVIQSGAGDSDNARRTFQASINVALYIVLPLIALFVALLSLAPVSRGLHLTQIGSRGARFIIALSGLSLWFQTLRGLMVAALYATGSYGFAYTVQGLIKLLELAGIALAVTLFSGTQVSAALIVAATSLLELCIIALYARAAAPWARLDLRRFDGAWLRAQFKPAFGFMLSNLATGGLMAQGPRVVLAATLGGPAVALYAIYTTAMRIVDQMLLSLVLPLEVEIARCAGRNDLRRIHQLVVVGTHVSWVLFALAAVVLTVAGPLIFRVWTGARIDFSLSLMLAFLAMSAANLTGRVSQHALISTNRLYGPSYFLFVSAALALVLGAVLARSFGVHGMVLGGIAGEVCNSIIALMATAAWLALPFPALLGDLLEVRASINELRSRSREIWSRVVRPSAG